jgi:hypothetical protein
MAGYNYNNTDIMVVTLKLQHDKSVKTICAGNEMTLIWFAVGYLLCYRNLGK